MHLLRKYLHLRSKYWLCTSLLIASGESLVSAKAIFHCEMKKAFQ